MPDARPLARQLQQFAKLVRAGAKADAQRLAELRMAVSETCFAPFVVKMDDGTFDTVTPRGSMAAWPDSVPKEGRDLYRIGQAITATLSTAPIDADTLLLQAKVLRNKATAAPPTRITGTFTQKQLAAKLEVKDRTILNWCDKCGIPPRVGHGQHYTNDELTKLIHHGAERGKGNGKRNCAAIIAGSKPER